MSAKLNLQRGTVLRPLPTRALVQRWVDAAYGPDASAAQVTVRLVDEDEGRQLNRDFRGCDRPTNVLSFPFEAPSGWPLRRRVLGDVVVCVPVVQREAEAQGKALEAHYAHLVVHGVLHLLGHDHEQEDEALRMEALETQIITGLGYPNPYRSQD